MLPDRLCGSPAALDGANRQLLEIVVNLLVPANLKSVRVGGLGLG